MKLKKELNLLHVFCITAGAMMSSGLFILPGLAHALSGPAIIVSYLLAGLLAIPGLLSQAELATAMPKAGGTYYYITRSLGPAVGTVYGLITWLALALKSAFALVGMAAFIVLIFNVDSYQISALLCLVFVVINIVGIKGSGRLQVLLVFTILTALLVYIILGLPEIQPQNLVPFAPKGLLAVASTAGFVFVSYGGLLNVASVAEEVQDPVRVLPLGMILSLIIVSLFYIMVIFITTGVMDASALDGSLTPISDGAGAFLGTGGRIALGIVAIFAFSSAANAGIMAASRYPMALGRDSLLPEFFGKISSRFNTPHISIFITGVFIVFALMLKLDILVKAASSVIIITYMFTCLSVIILRESRLQNYQPKFRAPLYPWIQIIGIIGCGLLLFRIGEEAFFISLILIFTGLIVYMIYGRPRSEREYALLHLIERITAKELTSHSLETELKEVIRERDDITKDRFDHIIEDCVILDIEKSLTVDKFFEIVADKMADNLKIKKNKLVRLLQEREKESHTALTPEMAIPHIVIKGEHTFDILVARCAEGVYFSKIAPKVHAIFVLVGSMDERNFHLRALAAIAQIVHDPDFEEIWLKAKGKEVLRDIVLLGKRKR